MRYILYARKSTENEDRQVQSIDDQLRILRDTAEARGWEILEEITESRSAKAPGERPGFERLLKKIERGEADAILCWSVNRLTRNPIDGGRLSWLLQNGVLQSIQTPEKQFLPTDNVLILSVETGTANQYILDLRKAVKRGIESKLQKGWYPHRAPEGYVNDLREHTIVPDHEGDRFQLLQRSWRLLVDGTHTPAHVLDLLSNEWGYMTRGTVRSPGKKLSRSAGYRLFSNIFYAGYFEHAGILYRGSHTPMITLTEYEQVQQRLHGPNGLVTRRRRHEFPYRGLMRCARCGGAISADVQAGRHGRGHWTYYHCANAAGLCSKRGIREEALEAQINASLRQVRITQPFKKEVMALLERWICEERLSHEGDYRREKATLTESEKMLDELLDLRLRGLIDDTAFQAKRRNLQDTVTRLRVQHGKTEERIARTRQSVENALNYRLYAYNQFLKGDAEQRRHIATALSSRYLFLDGSLTIDIPPLLSFVLEKTGAKQPVCEGEIKTPTADARVRQIPGAPSIPRRHTAPSFVVRHTSFPRHFEPRIIRSQSAKETSEKSKVSPGWDSGTSFEQEANAMSALDAFDVFELIWKEDIVFSWSPAGTAEG